MFLANTFKEKVKNSYLDGGFDPFSTKEIFYYKEPKKDPRVLFSFKDLYKNDPEISVSSNLNTQQLQALDKTEWENTFNLKRLSKKWKVKTELDFEPNFKKFTNNAMFPRAKPAKEYVQNLRDPDLLELKQKFWNKSTNSKEKYRPELKKTLFEVSNGLKDFKIVPLKEPKINEGVESRDVHEIDGNAWNISNFVDEKEMKSKEKDTLVLAQENSNKYWKENEDNREEEKPFPIDEERKKIEIIRYFKKYRNPYQKLIDYSKTMDKVKELTLIEKENAEKKVKYNNPGLLPRYPEKVNALILKELHNTYKDKYNEITGKLSNKELRQRQIQQNKFRWNDKDLANKIIAINNLNNSGVLNLDIDKNTSIMRLSKSQNKSKMNILLPLVVKGTEIELEQEKIKEKLDEDFKKQKKLEILLEKKTFKKRKPVEKFISKYPLSKNDYEFHKTMEKNLSMDFSNKPEDQLDKRIKYLKTSSNIDLKTSNSILNEISKNSNCNPLFLEAYSKIADKEISRINNITKKNEDRLSYEYTHPGTYREFVFTEKIKKKNVGHGTIADEENDPKNYEETQVVNKFWSCCMNSDPNSKGCHRRIIKSFSYLYDE
jgi:hypothetical protein